MSQERSVWQHPLTYVVLGWNALMVVWVVSALASQEPCEPGLEDACNAGTALGIGFIMVIAALGDVILGVLWLVTKPSGKREPAALFTNPAAKGWQVGPGWWQASDGLWYPPELRPPDATRPPAGAGGRGEATAGGPSI